jgi:hypothetical protein
MRKYRPMSAETGVKVSSVAPLIAAQPDGALPRA